MEDPLSSILLRLFRARVSYQEASGYGGICATSECMKTRGMVAASSMGYYPSRMNALSRHLAVDKWLWITIWLDEIADGFYLCREMVKFYAISPWEMRFVACLDGQFCSKQCHEAANVPNVATGYMNNGTRHVIKPCYFFLLAEALAFPDLIAFFFFLTTRCSLSTLRRSRIRTI